MGIRFLCHACQRKLNIKTFLAGKRGVCPHCGTSVDIPLESTVDKKGNPLEPATLPSTEVGQPSGTPASAAVVPRPSSPISASGAMAPMTAAAPATAAAPVAPTAPAVPVNAAVMPAPVSTPAPAAAPASVGDPIDEAPNATWYVRPPSGGQYGPARGDIMRKWLAEGRVSSDSMVWREGWTDWQLALNLFPSLPGGSSAGNGPTSGGAVAVQGDSPATSRVPARKKRGNNTMAVVAVVMLGVMSLLLLGLLIYVVSGS